MTILSFIVWKIIYLPHERSTFTIMQWYHQQNSFQITLMLFENPETITFSLVISEGIQDSLDFVMKTDYDKKHLVNEPALLHLKIDFCQILLVTKGFENCVLTLEQVF